MPSSAGTPLTLYTVPSSTTTIVLGLILCNVDTSQRTVDVQLVSDTSDTETNATVKLLEMFQYLQVQVWKYYQVVKLCYKLQTC